MHSKRKYLFLLIWMGLITYASLTPSDKVPDFTFIPHFDKVVHFCMYFGLAFLLVPVVLRNKKYLKSYFISFLIAATAGEIFELLQTYIATSRSGSIFDEIANATGAFLGVLAYRILISNKKLERVIFRIE